MAMTAVARSDELNRLLRDIGPVWQQDIRSAGDRVKAAYLPLLMAARRERVAVQRDLPYGTHARQLLDLGF